MTFKPAVGDCCLLSCVSTSLLAEGVGLSVVFRYIGVSRKLQVSKDQTLGFEGFGGPEASNADLTLED